MPLPKRKPVSATLIATALCMNIFTVSGCSSIKSWYSEDEKAEKPKNVSNEEVAEFIDEWRALEPQLAQLSTLQDDLALVLAEVNRQSSLNALPKQYADTRQTDHVAAEEEEFPLDEAYESGSDAPRETDEPAAERQIYAAHLAYFLREDTAWQGWERLAQKIPMLKDTFTASVEEVKRDRQTLYSLRIGPFESQSTSARVCAMFNKYRFQCSPVTTE